MTAFEFNSQILKYSQPLQYFAKSLTSNNEEAKDLLQDTMLKAMTYKDKFAEKTNLKAWLYTIMKNTFINNYRRKARANTIMDDTRELYFLNVPQDSGFNSPEASFDIQEMETAVRLGLNITVLILRDDAYGMIRWKQANMGFKDYGLTFGNPDFVKYAESYGAHGHRVESADHLQELLASCLGSEGVHLIDCPVDYSDNDRILNHEIKELSAKLDL